MKALPHAIAEILAVDPFVSGANLVLQVLSGELDVGMILTTQEGEEWELTGFGFTSADDWEAKRFLIVAEPLNREGRQLRERETLTCVYRDPRA